MTAADGWRAARRVLCVRLDAIGDVLMTTPAIRALASMRPGRRMTLLTSSAGAAVAPLLPVVDDVLVYDPPWMKATGGDVSPTGHAATIARLRAEGFDAAVVFTVYSQSALPAALLCFEAGIPLRAAHCRENPYHLLTDWVREPEPERLARHEVRRQLDLVRTLGAATSDERMTLAVPADARRAMRRRLAAMGVAPDAPWIAVHPGASAPSRRYPADGFVRAGRVLATRGLPIVLVGATSEADVAGAIADGIGPSARSMAGRTTIPELAALLELASVVLANNSGPMHLAAAVGTPVVALYALTNPQHTPWRVPSRVLSHDVPCRLCYRSTCPEGHHDCLRRVPPEDVAAAVTTLLDATRRPRGRPVPAHETLSAAGA